MNARLALGELYKKHPVFTKIRLFEIQYRNFFLWRGNSPFPRPLPSKAGSPLPIPHPFGSILAHTALESGVSPQLLIREPPLFGSHTSFLGNDPCLMYLHYDHFQPITTEKKHPLHVNASWRGQLITTSIRRGVGYKHPLREFWVKWFSKVGQYLMKFCKKKNLMVYFQDHPVCACLIRMGV